MSGQGEHRSGFVSFVGRPNAGKSTLTNALVGQKVVITSDKPQTTRTVVRGIVHREDAQLILVDTPGLHRPRTLLGERLNDLVATTLAEVDVVAVCFPANEKIGPGDRFIATEMAKVKRTQKVAIATKTDLASSEQIGQHLLDILWTGFVARSTVLVYNPDLVSESELPESIMDLAEPKWAGKVSFSPTGADFQAIVAAVLDLKGEKATREWLAGLKANGTVYDGNNVVLESVNSGETATGIEYHYYWYRDQAESGDNSDGSKLYFFGNQDPGAFVSISGAGVLKNGENSEEAQKFVAFLTSEEGQQALADSYALEYPLNPAVSLKPPVKPFSELEPPKVAISDLDNDKVVEMLSDAGFVL